MESALAVQKLKPTIDAIKRQYGDDKKAIQRETTALYEASGVNPAAGQHCSSTLLSRCVASYKQMVAYFVGALGMPRHAIGRLARLQGPWQAIWCAYGYLLIIVYASMTGSITVAVGI